jgi:catechol 2,3-dioxygenase-like lactoylglutathione lyase family enzyme
MIVGLDHVQVAIPAGAEESARAFYGELLGMTEVPKPTVLARRGGCWFTSGTAVLHLGVAEPFVPATKAHPGFVVDDLEALVSALEGAGHPCVFAEELDGAPRFHVRDPFGNRLEFQAETHPPAQPARD